MTLNVMAIPFGGSGYLPVTGDFAGDGLSDLAVYEQATGYWFFRLSGSYYSVLGVFDIPFGGTAYSPAP